MQVARAYLAALRADAALETAQANVDLSKALLEAGPATEGCGNRNRASK